MLHHRVVLVEMRCLEASGKSYRAKKPHFLFKSKQLTAIQNSKKMIHTGWWRTNNCSGRRALFAQFHFLWISKDHTKCHTAYEVDFNSLGLIPRAILLFFSLT